MSETQEPKGPVERPVRQYEYEVWYDGDLVASAVGPMDSALAEVRRYAYQYAQDGDVEIWQVERTRIV